MSLAWIYLVLAGLLEVVWAIGLKYTEGFTKPLPSIITITAMIASMALLGKALKDLPIGTAYGVWVGIGTVGAAIFGMILFNEAATIPRLMFLSLLIISIIGLKMTA